jgi:CrcB protein
MNPVLNPAVLFAIAGGGALGSLIRYLVGVAAAQKWGTDFPWGTLIVNVTGSFVIGLFAATFALKYEPSHAVRAFLVVGICGGYTTFSTFALDATTLMNRGAALPALGYVMGSVVLSVIALYAANYLARSLFN